MKKVRILLCALYAVPFAFLAMYEDATNSTLWCYAVMIIGFALLCRGCIKTDSGWIVLFGNILSFVSSLLFAVIFKTEKWDYYFKPFSYAELIIFESVIAFIIQIIFVIIPKRKKRDL